MGLTLRFDKNEFLSMDKQIIGFLMEQPRPLSVYFRSFHHQLLQKNCRLKQNLTSGRRETGHAR